MDRREAGGLVSGQVDEEWTEEAHVVQHLHVHTGRYGCPGHVVAIRARGLSAQKFVESALRIVVLCLVLCLVITELRSVSTSVIYDSAYPAHL